MKALHCFLSCIGLVVRPDIVVARCLGPHSFQTCNDNESGAYFNVSRFGKETVVFGVKPETGRTYQQFSTTLGGMTYTDGIDGRGRPWNEVKESFTRNFSDIYGVDPNGKPFSNMQVISPIDKNKGRR